MRPLPHAAWIALFALPAAAQLPPEARLFPYDGPEATCVFRLVGTVSADSSPHEPRLSPNAGQARELLARWEAASQSHLPVTEAERLRLRYSSPERSGQELNLACEFQGQINAEDLTRRYEWATVVETGAVVQLTATPKDALDRLFCDRFTVTLDSAWRPVEIHFGAVPASRSSSVALRPWVDDGIDADGAIHLVGFESDEEVRERPIRTADLSDEPPRLLRDDSPLALPPAPIRYDFPVPTEPVEAPRPRRS